ncbi:MAG: hypothetical protein JW943_10230 [Deltaproteobacteria bacterium]|nr:hypothetical protein [Deltaproteobacteria bacterium]
MTNWIYFRRSPENGPHIESPFFGAIQYIEKRTMTIRHLKILIHKGNRHPYGMLSLFNGFTNPPKSWRAIDKGANRIT